ncbi:MAG: TonB family protein [Azoarcus sp.]|nr:TonB family protein [Azoarcus sp.]
MSYTSYAAQQRDPRRHITGITLAILFHIVLGYALMNGLAREVVKIISDPLNVSLIEEVKPEPPPPPPPPPKRIVRATRPQAAPPPPSYVPPPEVVVEAPVIESPITIVQTDPPAAAPVAPVAPQPAPVVAAAIGVTCPNHMNIRSSVPYPPQALRLNRSGEVMAEFIVDAGGDIGNVRIAKSSDPLFNRVVTDAIRRFRCVGQGRPVRVTVPFRFTLDA